MLRPQAQRRLLSGLLVLLSTSTVVDARPRRKIIRLEAMDRCLGRIARPIVLIAIGPASPLAGAAQLCLGQSLAAGSTPADLAAASAAFTSAASTAPAAVREAALFELGRVRYRLDDNRGAAAAFADALDGRSAALRAETLRELAIVLGDECNGGGPDQVQSLVAARPERAWLPELRQQVAVVSADRGAASPQPAGRAEEVSSCDPRVVSHVLFQRRPGLVACMAARHRGGERAQLLSLSIVVDASGAGSGAVHDAAPGDSALSTCGSGALRDLRLPKPEEACQQEATLMMLGAPP